MSSTPSPRPASPSPPRPPQRPPMSSLHRPCDDDPSRSNHDHDHDHVHNHVHNHDLAQDHIHAHAHSPPPPPSGESTALVHPGYDLSCDAPPTKAPSERSATTSMGRERSTSVSTMHDDEPPPESSLSPSASVSSLSRENLDRASYRASPSPAPSTVPSMLSYGSATSRPSAQRPAVPSLSTVTQQPPLRWDYRGVSIASGPRELIESIQDLRELRHVLREERAQTLQRLQDLDYRVAAAETKIHQHLQQQRRPSSSSSGHGRGESSNSRYMPSPPTSPTDSRRSFIPSGPPGLVSFSEPCRFRSEEEELLGSLDRFRIARESHERYTPSHGALFPPLQLPKIQPVMGWPEYRSDSEYRASPAPSTRSGYRRSPSPDEYNDSIVSAREHHIGLAGPPVAAATDSSYSGDNNAISEDYREEQGTSRTGAPALVPPPADYTMIPASSRATRSETPEQQEASAQAASSVASSSKHPKRASGYDDSDSSEDEQPLSKLINEHPPAKRPRVSSSPTPSESSASASPPSTPQKQEQKQQQQQTGQSGQHQGTFTFVGTTVVADPARRRLVTKRQSRPGKIPCDHQGSADEPRCPMRFTRHADMVRHRESIHGAQQGKYRCPVCGKSLSRADAVKRHILGATDYIHADFVAKRGREIDGGGDWWRTLVEADGEQAAAVVADVKKPQTRSSRR